MQPLISVIVPIYKVEAYLERAVDSVLCQTYENLEIILVDDGSPDNCPRMCDAYSKKDARIRVIHKENGGLSDARNAGISIARGEYVAFLDSDDYIAPQFINKLYNACIKYDSDIAICQYEISNEPENIFENRNENLAEMKKADLKIINKEDIINKKAKFQTFSRQELLLRMYEEYHPRNTDFIVTWNKLYKRKLWNNICFPKNRIHEDEATTYKIYDKCARGVYIQEKLYVYYQANDSITRQHFGADRMDWFTALKERIEFFAMLEDRKLMLQSYKAYADASIRFYKRYMEETDNSTALCRQCKENVKETLQKTPKIGGLPCKTKIGYFIFLTNQRMYFKLLKNLIS